jgi:D-alanyl-D-alanine carboxypeptidase/D-alanyl-D-alanine-endopeptidase (penicillin-binding protein 4)
MKKKLLFLFYCCIPLYLAAQNVEQKLSVALSKLETDSQFQHAIISLHVVNSKTGELVFEKNSRIGLAPASCQKVVTSVAAFELLGKEFTYKTDLSYSGTIIDKKLNGNIYLTSHGDPTLGSWRWKQTSEEAITNKIIDELKNAGIRNFNDFLVDNSKWGTQTIPNGWVWEDIGNYFGAGSGAFNWHENQYDIILKSGSKIGDDVTIISQSPESNIKLISELKTAAKGTGDQAYIFFTPNSSINYIRGTIPVGNESFTVKAAAADAVNLFSKYMNTVFKQSGFRDFNIKPVQYDGRKEIQQFNHKLLYSFVSPTLDSINYWFLKKSVNLFGESFVKSIGYNKRKTGTTDSGISVIRDFWSKNGVNKSALKIIDGSGLSPANRITTQALVTVMQYAKSRPWFESFFHALPEMNGIKMKDGYIGGVRSYTGYVKSDNGKEFTFSFIVNNFDGNPGSAREKIWKVLDILK